MYSWLAGLNWSAIAGDAIAAALGTIVGGLVVLGFTWFLARRQAKTDRLWQIEMARWTAALSETGSARAAKVQGCKKRMARVLNVDPQELEP